MKRTLAYYALALALAPTVTFAQSIGPVTRAQVRAEVSALRQAGYTGDTEASYPDKLLDAERRIAEGRVVAPGTGVGGTADGRSESGAGTHGNAGEIPGLRPIYSGN